jgi:hypothetical protein
MQCDIVHTCSPGIQLVTAGQLQYSNIMASAVLLVPSAHVTVLEEVTLAWKTIPDKMDGLLHKWMEAV